MENLNVNCFNQLGQINVKEFYRHINTDQVLKLLTDNSNLVVENEICMKTKKVEKRGYQKHLAILSSPELNLGSERIQLLVTNSHDGLSSLKFNIGIYRLICANGLILGKSFFEFRVTHLGDTNSKINQALTQFYSKIDQVKNVITLLKSSESSQDFRDFLIDQVLTLRDLKNDSIVNVDTNRILKPSRSGDLSRDNWTVFNIAQESLIRGGFKYVKKNDQDINRVNTVKNLKSISSITELNKSLFDNTLNYLKIA